MSDHLPSLSDLASNPSLAAEVPPERVPALLLQVNAVQGALATRLGEAAVASPNSASALQEPDQLLAVKEAAKRLATSCDYLYRHSAKLPFTVRISDGQLRFSARGIERYIRQHQGNGRTI